MSSPPPNAASNRFFSPAHVPHVEPLTCIDLPGHHHAIIPIKRGAVPDPQVLSPLFPPIQTLLSRLGRYVSSLREHGRQFRLFVNSSVGCQVVGSTGIAAFFILNSLGHAVCISFFHPFLSSSERTLKCWCQSSLE